MCGRFAFTMPKEAMSQLFGAVVGNDLPEGARYNVCPTQDIVAVVSRDGARRLVSKRWGLVPAWYKTLTDGPLLINARAETIAGKPAFREAVRARRCLIPADGFYEWTAGGDGSRLPWYITAASGAPLAFAGVWQDWDAGGVQASTCAIVTCAAGPQMTAIHHREPVVIDEGDWPLWLGEAGKGAAPLLVPQPEGRFAMHRVGVAVNSNRAAGPDLTAPLAPA